MKDTLVGITLQTKLDGSELLIHTKNDKHTATPFKNGASLRDIHHHLLMTARAFETLIRIEEDLEEFNERVG